MSEVLILFTIGPVQRFIETARKTEDLWIGSYILSYLNGIAITTSLEEFLDDEKQVIFPAIEGHLLLECLRNPEKKENLNDEEKEQLRLPTLPNRFLAKGTCTKADLEHVEEEVRKKFREIAEESMDNAFGTKWRGTYAQEIFDRQIDNFLEVYWVIHPITESSYKEAYNNLEKESGGAKNCRWFKQIAEESRKCSLCGEREVIHFEAFSDNTNMGKMARQIERDWKENWIKTEKRSKYLNPDEYLCAVCLSKRLGEHYFESTLGVKLTGTFPSTAEVSTAAFKSTLTQNQEYLNIYKNFAIQLKKNIRNIPTITMVPKIISLSPSWNIDGQWLFEESLQEDYLKKYYFAKAKSLPQEVRECLPELSKTQEKLTKNLDPTPSKYYAIIVMDGDDMGRKLAEIPTSEEHSAFSQMLNGYIVDVQRIVEHEHLGKLLYAGGDDLLALANLQDLFMVLRELRQKFPPLRNIPALAEMSSSVSFGTSAGVCIAHYKIPLGEVLNWARKMEKEAKRGKKDAIGIALLKHSGNISKTVVTWEFETFTTMNVALRLSYALQKYLSKKFLYTLHEEFERMFDQQFGIEQRQQTETMMQAELFRLMHRHQKRKNFPDVQNKECEQLFTTLTNQLGTLLNTLVRKSSEGFQQFIGFLEICNFIAKEAQYETFPETD